MTRARALLGSAMILSPCTSSASAAGMLMGGGTLLVILGVVFFLVGGLLAGLFLHAVLNPWAKGSALRAACIGMALGLASFSVVYVVLSQPPKQEVRERDDRERVERLRMERGLAELAAMRPGTVRQSLEKAIAILGDDATPGTLVLLRRNGPGVAFPFGAISYKVMEGIARALGTFERAPTADDVAALDSFVSENDAAFAAHYFPPPRERRQSATEFFETLPNGDFVQQDLRGALFWATGLGTGDDAAARARCGTLPEFVVENCRRGFDRAKALRGAG